jgi:hypothetical protein
MNHLTKVLYSDLGKLSLYCKQKSRQLHQIGEHGVMLLRYSEKSMDFEKYSKQNSILCGVNLDTTRKLADDLQNDVNKEIHTAVLTAFLNVIEKLNTLGHHLTPYDEISPGEISFRDEPTEK